MPEQSKNNKVDVHLESTHQIKKNDVATRVASVTLSEMNLFCGTIVSDCYCVAADEGENGRSQVFLRFEGQLKLLFWLELCSISRLGK